MNKLQVRIGKILSIFSLVIFIIRSILYWIEDKYGQIITLDNLSFFIYFITFSITYLYINEITKLIQIGIVYFESVLCLNKDMDSAFFGLSMYILTNIICYIYGYFIEHKKIKIIVLILVQYILYVLFPLYNNVEKYIIAFKWVLFTQSFLLILWYVLKDSIEQMKEKEFIERGKLIQLLEDTKNIARDALNAYEKYSKEFKKE